MTTKTWRDTTGYAQGDRAKGRQPDCWSLRLSNNASISVTHGHIYYPGEWITSFYPFYTKRPLKMPADQFTAEQAQAKALILARHEVDKLVEALK